MDFFFFFTATIYINTGITSYLLFVIEYGSLYSRGSDILRIVKSNVRIYYYRKVRRVANLRRQRWGVTMRIEKVKTLFTPLKE